MIKNIILIFLFFLIGCESTNNESFNQVNSQISINTAQIDSLNRSIEIKIADLKKLESKIDIFQKQINKINSYQKYDLNEIEELLSNQQSDIQSFKSIISITLQEFKEIKTSINQIDNALNNLQKKQTANKPFNQLESRVLSIPFDPKLNKIDLGLFLKNSKSIFEVEILSVENLKHTSKDSLIDFQLTITSQLNLNNVPQNGLVSFYQYSQPERGIINSTSAKLLIKASNPFVYLDGNDEYQIYGNLILKVSGNFE